MENIVISSLYDTIDQLSKVTRPAGTPNTTAHNLLRIATIEQLMSKKPCTLQVGDKLFELQIWKNPDLSYSIEKLTPYAPQTAALLMAIHQINTDEKKVMAGTRLLLECYQDKSICCRIALAICCLRGIDGKNDSVQGINLATASCRIKGAKGMAAVENDLKQTPYNPDLFLNDLGAAYFNTHDVIVANLYFKRALELKGDDADMLHNVCVSLTEQKKYHEAFPYLLKAAVGGDKSRYYYLGYCWYYGYDKNNSPLTDKDTRTEQQVSQAVRWLTLCDHKLKFPLLSEIYFHHVTLPGAFSGTTVKRGTGVLKPQDAVKVFQAGANAGDNFSMLALAQFTLCGWGIAENRTEAINLTRRGVDAAVTPRPELYQEALYDMAMKFSADEKEQRRYLERYITEYPNSILSTALYYKLGSIVFHSDKVYPKAADLLLKADSLAQKVNNSTLAYKLMPALYEMLGDCYYNLKQYNFAKHFYELSANQEKSGYSAYMVGYLYHYNKITIVTTEDKGRYRIRMAVAAYKEGIELGFKRGAKDLFLLLRDRNGYNGHDYWDEDTSRYAQMAIEENKSVEAMYYLGLCYLARKDTKKATEYLRMAHINGHRDAIYIIAAFGYMESNERLRLLWEMTERYENPIETKDFTLNAQNARYYYATEAYKSSSNYHRYYAIFKMEEFIKMDYCSNVWFSHHYYTSESGQSKEYKCVPMPYMAAKAIDWIIPRLAEIPEYKRVLKDRLKHMALYYQSLKSRSDGKRVLDKDTALRDRLDKVVFDINHPLAGGLKKLFK